MQSIFLINRVNFTDRSFLILLNDHCVLIWSSPIKDPFSFVILTHIKQPHFLSKYSRSRDTKLLIIPKIMKFDINLTFLFEVQREGRAHLLV
jgi:hypothetical protein